MRTSPWERSPCAMALAHLPRLAVERPDELDDLDGATLAAPRRRTVAEAPPAVPDDLREIGGLPAILRGPRSALLVATTDQGNPCRLLVSPGLRKAPGRPRARRSRCSCSSGSTPSTPADLSNRLAQRQGPAPLRRLPGRPRHRPGRPRGPGRRPAFRGRGRGRPALAPLGGAPLFTLAKAPACRRPPRPPRPTPGRSVVPADFAGRYRLFANGQWSGTLDLKVEARGRRLGPVPLRPARAVVPGDGPGRGRRRRTRSGSRSSSPGPARSSRATSGPRARGRWPGPRPCSTAPSASSPSARGAVRPRGRGRRPARRGGPPRRPHGRPRAGGWRLSPRREDAQRARPRRDLEGRRGPRAGRIDPAPNPRRPPVRRGPSRIEAARLGGIRTIRRARMGATRRRNDRWRGVSGCHRPWPYDRESGETPTAGSSATDGDRIGRGSRACPTTCSTTATTSTSSASTSRTSRSTWSTSTRRSTRTPITTSCSPSRTGRGRRRRSRRSRTPGVGTSRRRFAYDDVRRERPAPRVSQAMQAFRTLLGENDMLAYLSMMAPRLVELHRVLKPTGSIYLHCDPTASHYLKLLDGRRSSARATSATRLSGSGSAPSNDSEQGIRPASMTVSFSTRSPTIYSGTVPALSTDEYRQ